MQKIAVISSYILRTMKSRQKCSFVVTRVLTFIDSKNKGKHKNIKGNED